MSDLISRAEALNALDEQIWQCNKALSTFDISMKDEYAVKVERASLMAFRMTLEYMPSAQPMEDARAMCGECDAWNQYKNYLQEGGKHEAE